MLAWVRLIRMPNLATAVADSLAGYLVVSGLTPLDWPPAVCWLAMLASLAFYAAGMVLNDVYDVDLDRVERPERPLPSGAIAVTRAALVGQLLMAGGAAAACGTAVVTGLPWPALVGALLSAAIWLYDRRAKGTAAGPAVMGSCRGLNWLLGMTAAGGPTELHEWAIPLGMAIYVAGITLFARDEAGSVRRGTLLAGMAAMAAGLVIAAGFAWIPWLDGASRLATLPVGTWLACWAILGMSVLLRAVEAVADPVPARVRAAVGNAIMAIITLDAVLVLAACGERWAIVVIGLLAWFLVGRRLVPPT
ncbi:MAG: UbiA family prenyltransferase [Pirellulales bacterium]